MTDSLFDIYINRYTAKEIWNTLEVKYVLQDKTRKKFFNYKIVDDRLFLSSLTKFWIF